MWKSPKLRGEQNHNQQLRANLFVGAVKYELLNEQEFDLQLWKVTQMYAWHIWRARFFSECTHESSQICGGYYFTASKVTFMKDDTAVYMCCHFFCAPSWSECVPRVVCGAKEANEVCCFVFFGLWRLKHLMGFLSREVEIRENPTVRMVPCLGLISVSICIRHCSGGRVRIRFISPGGAFLPCCFRVCKLTVLW